MNKILIIGAGQIGSRHLQALSKLNDASKVVVFDPSSESLKTAKMRYEQMPANDKVAVDYIQQFSDLSGDFNVCVVATTSDVRSKALIEMFKHCSVKNIILEKFLFPSVNEYHEAAALFKNHNVKAWVNCANRVNPAYKVLKENLGKGQKLSYSLQGGNWGLLCNSIHYFDLLSYLTEQYDYTFDLGGLDKEYVPSKRDKFIEGAGSIVGTLPNGSQAMLFSDPKSSADVVQNIMGMDAQFSINETKGTIRSAFLSNNWVWEEKPLKIAYQSELTNVVVEDIIKRGDCNLPTYEQSSRIHLNLITALIKHFNLKDYLPVT
ncbi:MAG: Gfo/Idh/MocA family oxidoreductase [bacterium]